jgi:hypothetical protein
VWQLGVVVAAMLFLAIPAPAAVVGEQRVLVVRATWGPPVATDEQTRQAVAAASEFVRKSSFGKASLRADVASPITIARLQCVNRTGEEFYESRIAPARAAAVAAGYDVSAWDRVVYVLPSSRNEPDDACRDLSIGRGREALVMGEVSARAIVHELGHTWTLGHARGADCRLCRQDEYGDPFSPMGRGYIIGPGSDDFSAFEKLRLGWISKVETVRRGGTYAIGPSARTSARHALVVPTAHGRYWLEHRSGELLVRLVLGRSPDGAYGSPTLLIGRSYTRRQQFCDRGVLSARIVPRRGGTAAIRVTLRPRRC